MYTTLSLNGRASYWKNYLAGLIEFKKTKEYSKKDVKQKILLSAEIIHTQSILQLFMYQQPTEEAIQKHKSLKKNVKNSNKKRSVLSTLAEEHTFLCESIQSRIVKRNREPIRT